MCEVSIIIVDYFKAERVLKNIEGILSQHCDFDIEIIVVDNSCDKSNRQILEKLPKERQISLIYNKTNVGYISACNQAAKLCTGKYIILVNPDIIWESDNILSKLISKFSEEVDIGIIGTRQKNDDGTIPDTVRRFPDLIAQISRRTFLRKIPLLKNRVEHYEVNDFDYHISADVDWLQSSFMAIRQELWAAVGGLDPAYYLFMADPDICYKAWQNGYRVYYDSDIVVGADGKRCSAGGILSILTNKVVRYHLRDAINYQLKYLFKPANPRGTRVK